MRWPRNGRAFLHSPPLLCLWRYHKATAGSAYKPIADIQSLHPPNQSALPSSWHAPLHRSFQLLSPPQVFAAVWKELPAAVPAPTHRWAVSASHDNASRRSSMSQNTCSFLNSYPVGIHPATIAFGIGLGGNKAELRTNPLALLHLELLSTVGKFLAILTPEELHLRILHFQA